jgi:hypothetical protein
MLRLELTIRKSQVAKNERGAKQFVGSILTVRATPQSLVRHPATAARPWPTPDAPLPDGR